MKAATGVDIGGTFTDIIAASEDGSWAIAKVLSTTADYGQGMLAGITAALAKTAATQADLTRVAHGTTVASNAVLEESGIKPALVTTLGFRDVIEIGRLRMPRLYDVNWVKPPPLVPRELRFEIRERRAADGGVIEPLDPASVRETIAVIRATGVRAVAISLINSFADPTHEQQIARAFAELAPEIDVSVGTEISSMIREVERTSTVIVNAYLRPVLDNYLSTLRAKLDTSGITAPLFICQSTGGLTTAADARLRPVAILESGPAAGVVAAAALARRLSISQMISFDMGGTTAKAALIENGEFSLTDTFTVGSRMMNSTRLLSGAGHPVQMPAVDLAEVGAGGGSIIRIDGGGALVVGPESAGASPGPACYGLGGDRPTVTDASVVLGYVSPTAIAGGEVPIHIGRARDALNTHIASKLNLSIENAAYAAVQVAAATMLRALRAVSSERGRDPRTHVVAAFGGNGPLFGPILAQQLGATHLLIPPNPGVFSAVGLLQAGFERDTIESLHGLLTQIDPLRIDNVLQRLRRNVQSDLAAAGFPQSRSATELRFSLRYAGQTDTLIVTLPETQTITAATLALAASAFGEEHERTYGHRAGADEPVELAAIHVVGKGFFDPITLAPAPPAEQGRGLTRRAYFGPGTGWIEVPITRRADLTQTTKGPLLIDEVDSTCLIPPGASAECDRDGNIHLHLETPV